VTATDADAGENARIRYVIPGHGTSMFHVDQRGVVSSLASIDRETYDGFRFPVVAVDAGTPSRTGSELVGTLDGPVRVCEPGRSNYGLGPSTVQSRFGTVPSRSVPR